MIPFHSTTRIILVSTLGSFIGFIFITSMYTLEGLLGPGLHGNFVHIIVMVSVGITIVFIKKWLGDPGDINLLVDNIHVSGGRANIREIRSLIPISLLCIASGGAMGPEAPLVQTTAAIGTKVGEKYKLNVQELRILTISGMATGFAMLFGTPIGAAIFSLEIMHKRGFEYYEAFIPSVIGALIGYITNAVSSGFGLAPVWNIGAVHQITMIDILWGGGAGILGAGLGVIFVFLVRIQKKALNKLPKYSVPVLGGLGLGLLGLWNPYALTYGEKQLIDIFNGSMTVHVLIFAGLAKLLATSLTLSSEWKGGFIIPLFFIGAAFGHVVPSGFLGLSQSLVFSLSLMVALNTSVTKTPIGSALVVSGMCGLPVLAPCLIASLVSLMISNRLVLFTAQRNRSS